MEKVKRKKNATWKECAKGTAWKQCNTKKGATWKECNTENSAIWKEYKTKRVQYEKVQHGKSATQNECNMKQNEWNIQKKCTTIVH